MSEPMSFSGGEWAVQCYIYWEVKPTQAMAITTARELARRERVPALICWVEREAARLEEGGGGHMPPVPWGIVAANGDLVMLNKVQLKQVQWRAP